MRRSPMRIVLFVAVISVMLQMADTAEEAEEPEPANAVLFPWFAEAMGLVVFYLLTRYVEALPFTAVMFILGTFMGVGAVKLGLSDQLTESILKWDGIDSEVLLLVFLPGLIFNDSFTLDVHLFGASIWQCMTLAFPMVLAGTVLTALVGYYVFPYNWSFNLAMTFGSILSATDPVAVSALLDEVGAPPRLKMHISGESLLNDGSAMVFYTIFSQMYLFELGIEGVGGLVDVAQGFAIFFQMSLGGAAVGFAFALGLMTVLYLLNRRLTAEENVLQVASTITFAYLTYYVADQVCATSGVIATLTCGVVTQAFAKSMINDQEMMESFWGLVEHLLNALLFTLGGVVWGGIIANEGIRDGLFNAQEWGYLFLLFVLLNAIRFFLVFSFYPLISRIELKSSWQEATFLSYGGLRGAVGISLAIALDNHVRNVAADQPTRVAETTRLFGMIGGIAFLTLWINGTTAGPLLKKLGLARSTEIRLKVLNVFRQNFKKTMLGKFVDLLADERFRDLAHDIITHHVSFVRELTNDEFEQAIAAADAKAAEISKKEKETNIDAPTHSTEGTLVSSHNARELRTVYIEELKWAYRKQSERGELDGRVEFLAYVLQQGLEFTHDAVAKGNELNDWETSQLISSKTKHRAEKISKSIITLGGQCNKSRVIDDRARTLDYKDLRFDVNRAMAFIEAHRLARKKFKQQFQNGEFAEEAEMVMKESDAQVLQAKAMLDSLNEKDVEIITTHLFCAIFLHQSARQIESLATSGLLTEKEAGACIEDIEGQITSVYNCSGDLCKEGKSEEVEFGKELEKFGV